MGEDITFWPELDPSSKWAPKVGEFTTTYLQGLSVDDLSKVRILNESSQILANCLDPATPEFSEAGLVVGYVQSGKTMSFTTVTALARDNGYGIVIVLTGVTNLLKSQSVERLVDDLQLEDYPQEWRNFTNPGSKNIGPNNHDLLDVKDRLEAWKRFISNPNGRRKPTLIFTVLKQTSRLNNLANLLSLLDLTEVPVLMIDDESDQASPNNKSARNLKLGTEDSSSIYSAIENVRSRLTRHSYLQYTATPQANLLAAKTDALSPAFGRILSPGEDYIGGQEFFGVDKSKLVEIPEGDTITPRNLPEEPPKSLEKALMSFWIASAIAIGENHKNGNRAAIRSMMIQVSQQVAPQAIFRDWVLNLRRLWMGIVENSQLASHMEVKNDFELEFDDLKLTYPTAMDFGAVFELLHEAMSETRVVEVNSTEDAVKNIEWYESQFWILIGGMKLDRGFTVKGITTTYMPRSVSENAATLQQRARFFGYHKRYFGLCRLFIAKATVEAFETYLEHETELRDSLKENEGRPLSEWKRKFILGRALRRPVRASVIGIRMRNRIVKEGWVSPEFMHENSDAVVHNANLMTSFVELLRGTYSNHVSSNPKSWKDNRKSNPHVLFAGIEIKTVLDFLLGLETTNIKDVDKLLPLFTSLARKSQDATEVIDVVLINDLETAHLDGRRANDLQAISNVFIGRNPAAAGTNFDDLIYVGDGQIHTALPTLHLRFLKVLDLEEGPGASVLVPWIALHVDKELEQIYLEEMD